MKYEIPDLDESAIVLQPETFTKPSAKLYVAETEQLAAAPQAPATPAPAEKIATRRTLTFGPYVAATAIGLAVFVMALLVYKQFTKPAPPSVSAPAVIHSQPAMHAVPAVVPPVAQAPAAAPAPAAEPTPAPAPAVQRRHAARIAPAQQTASDSEREYYKALNRQLERQLNQ